VQINVKYFIHQATLLLESVSPFEQRMKVKMSLLLNEQFVSTCNGNLLEVVPDELRALSFVIQRKPHSFESD
jgi:hypothetical protein